MDTKQELNVKKSFLKPINEFVKLDVAMEMNSINVDEVRAENIALEVDAVARSKEKETVFENDIVDKIEMMSSKVLKDCGEFAVGVFNGTEMHVTSVKGKVQFADSIHFLYVFLYSIRNQRCLLSSVIKFYFIYFFLISI